ncbi:nicotinate-nucleotide adenylyltransferase [Rhodobacteraceae bacterium KN286]|uniref:Probable nicotinate-nucleotide adenylyltransferase n=2 Tax=Oceanomicrobium pacificus TaxID=2692916 RepID=A0A6B0TS17_9RHOB|nr:nicotinate-nucleotide adenylyltransferase [Oceanomicrobium pacificus]
MMHGFPIAEPGLRVGLLGGSFDPPHSGHVHITRWALRRFDLDQVWWLVSPGNPLKAEGPASLERRMAACHAIIDHPKVVITDLEARIGTRYTAQTLDRIFRHYPGTRFVWLMGADNLVQFHKWDSWDWIMENVPIGVLSRPGEQIRAGLSPAARRYARYRRDARRARGLPFAEAPAWTLLTGRMVQESSTRIRDAGHWPR